MRYVRLLAILVAMLIFAASAPSQERNQSGKGTAQKSDVRLSKESKGSASTGLSPWSGSTPSRRTASRSLRRTAGNDGLCTHEGPDDREDSRDVACDI